MRKITRYACHKSIIRALYLIFGDFVLHHYSMNLTWRDVQHIIVRTSRWRPLVDGNWVKNGAGMRGNDILPIYSLCNKV